MKLTQIIISISLLYTYTTAASAELVFTDDLNKGLFTNAYIDDEATNPPTGEPLTLNTVIASSASYPAILSAQAEINATKGDKRAADMQRFPSLSVLASTNGSSRISPVLQIQQPLWTGGKITGQIEQAEHAIESAQAKMQETNYGTELKAVAAWQNLILTKNSMKINKEVLANLKTYQQFMERRVAAGVSPEIELQLVLTRIEQIDADIRSSKALNQVAKIQIKQLTNSQYSDTDLDNIATIETQIEWVKKWFDTRVANDIPYFINNTADNHPSVIRAQRDAEVLKSVQKVKASAQYPTINLGYQYTINRNDSLYMNNISDNRVTLAVNYQPGAGLSAYETAKAAAIRAEGAINTINSTRLDVLESVNTDIQDSLSNQQRVDMLGDSVDASGKVLESYKRQFVAGKRTWFDVMNALRELTQNRLSVVTAKTAIVTSTYKLMVKSGAFQQYNGL